MDDFAGHTELMELQVTPRDHQLGLVVWSSLNEDLAGRLARSRIAAFLMHGAMKKLCNDGY
jgi:hypothetical protein